jgi:hypothetical protein
MNDESRRAEIRRFVELINISPRDMEPFDAFYQDDVVIDWPSPARSSGESKRSASFGSRFRLHRGSPCAASLVLVIFGRSRWSSTTTESCSTPSSFTSTKTVWWRGKLHTGLPRLSHPHGGLSGSSQHAQ